MFFHAILDLVTLTASQVFYNMKYSEIIFKFLAYSLVLHAILGGLLVWTSAYRSKDKADYQKIRVEIKEAPKPEPTVIPPRTEETKKLPKPKKQPDVANLNPKNIPPPKTKEVVKPVQGFRPEALTDGPSSIAVPIGNTLMVEDKGLRLDANQVKELNADLSSFAKLIPETFKNPEYTPEALDANFEGSFIVDVYVDEKGNVIDATLRKKIGFGMDQRIINAAKNSRFIPRKNSAGGPIAGWTEIKIILQIP